MWMPLLALMACAPESVDDALALECDGEGPSRTLLIQQIRFVRQTDGVSEGFDLDGQTDTCDVDDYVSPEGTESVDNAFAALLPALELTEARTMEDIIADSIRSGRLLLLIDLDDLDQDADDACVDVTLQRGSGVPMLGNDGEVLPGQTFDLDLDVPPSRVESATLSNHRVTASPLELTLPIQIFEYEFDFSLSDAVLQVTMEEDGRMHGLLAGGLSIQSVLDVASNPDVDPSLLPLIEGLLPLFADLEPDANGECQKLSMTFEFEAIDAFRF
ncbi:MAG: hypothetical protein R3F61_28095 [Myxococcota bacterium]